MKYIGIDMGSSVLKAVLVDVEAGRIVSQMAETAPQKEPSDNVNVYEMSAKHMVQLVKGLIDRTVAEHRDVRGVIISTQMHGFVYAVPGREDRYVSWQDMRDMDRMPGTRETYLSHLEKRISPEEMKSNGVYIKPSLGVCNLYTMLEEDPSLPRNGEFYTLGSYVIHALTGRNIAHIQNAAPSGIADVEHHCIDRKLLERLGLGEIKYPELAESDYQVCGTYRTHDCDILVYPDYGDMQMSILGCEIGEGDAVVNTSTGSQVIRYSKEFKPGSYEIRPYFDGSYLYTISNMPAGRNLAVLVNFFREIAEEFTGIRPDTQKIWERIHQGKGTAPDEDLRVEANFYKNPYFPEGGTMRGITQNNLHVDTIFAATYQNMAETYWHFLQELGEKPEAIKRIVCAGGVNWKTPELCEAIGRVSGKPWQLSSMENEAVAGLYRLALVCSGKYETMEECRKHPIDLR